MNELRQMEKELNEHIIFVYNNLLVGDNSSIDDKLVSTLYDYLACAFFKRSRYVFDISDLQSYSLQFFLTNFKPESI